MQKRQQGQKRRQRKRKEQRDFKKEAAMTYEYEEALDLEETETEIQPEIIEEIENDKEEKVPRKIQRQLTKQERNFYKDIDLASLPTTREEKLAWLIARKPPASEPIPDSINR